MYNKKKTLIDKLKDFIIKKGIPYHILNGKEKPKKIMYQGSHGWNKFLRDLSSLDDDLNPEEPVIVNTKTGFISLNGQISIYVF